MLTNYRYFYWLPIEILIDFWGTVNSQWKHWINKSFEDGFESSTRCGEYNFVGLVIFAFLNHLCDSQFVSRRNDDGDFVGNFVRLFVFRFGGMLIVVCLTKNVIICANNVYYKINHCACRFSFFLCSPIAATSEISTDPQFGQILDVDWIKCGYYLISLIKDEVNYFDNYTSNPRIQIPFWHLLNTKHFIVLIEILGQYLFNRFKDFSFRNFKSFDYLFGAFDRELVCDFLCIVGVVQYAIGLPLKLAVKRNFFRLLGFCKKRFKIWWLYKEVKKYYWKDQQTLTFSCFIQF